MVKETTYEIVSSDYLTESRFPTRGGGVFSEIKQISLLTSKYAILVY
jgi:hypothetical protein